MHQRNLVAATLTLLGLALAGCSTTGGSQDYSSLPTSPPYASRAGTMPAPPAWHSVSDGTSGDETGAGSTQAAADLLDRIRAGYALPQPQHASVDREVEWYRSRPDFLDRTFRRGSRYLHYIVTEIERRGLPMELALLPVVESAFNPVAYSRSRASGLWQFIPSTGKHYGLTQNWWIDERRDVLRATDAALTYLAYLNQYFNGDWYLAIAAYNGGEGTVSRAMQRNANAGRPTDFFSLDLKAETRDYVPKLLAISRIVADPAAYGLQFEPIPNQPYFGVVDPGRQVHIGEVADLAGVSRDDMFALNPAFNRMTTPPSGPHRLLVPVDRVEPLQAALATEDGAARVASTAAAPPEQRHRIRRGETLSSIARRYGVTVAALQEANRFRGTVIHPGDTLLIPTTQAAASATTAGPVPIAESRPEIAAQLPESSRAAPAGKPSVYTVRRGDTLWGVARKHGVTVPSLAAANGLSSNSQLTAGAKLQIPSAGGSAPAGETTRMTYQVRPGDTLSEIAQRFGVTVKQLMSWNQIRRSTSLRAGQRIVVFVDPRRIAGG